MAACSERRRQIGCVAPRLEGLPQLRQGSIMLVSWWHGARRSLEALGKLQTAKSLSFRQAKSLAGCRRWKQLLGYVLKYVMSCHIQPSSQYPHVNFSPISGKKILLPCALHVPFKAQWHSFLPCAHIEGVWYILNAPGLLCLSACLVSLFWWVIPGCSPCGLLITCRMTASAPCQFAW